MHTTAKQSQTSTRTKLMRAGLGCILLTAFQTSPASARCGLQGGVPNRVAALALAVAGNRAKAETTAKDPFVRGLAAYIGSDYQTAIKSLAQSAEDALHTRQSRKRHDELARDGYWGAKALDAIGRNSEAQQLRGLAVAQHGTFYALLIDSTLGLPGFGSYPTRTAAYHDPRANQALVWAVTREESGFNPVAASPAGAHGAMQVIDSTASLVTRSVDLALDKHRLRTDFNYSTAIGSTYLGSLLQRYNGNPLLAVAAYNAGPKCVDEWITALGDPRTQVDPVLWIEAIPLTETRSYVKHVMSSYMIYRAKEPQSAEN